MKKAWFWLVAGFLVLVLFLSGCSQNNGNRCGDNACQDEERRTGSCPVDCAAQSVCGNEQCEVGESAVNCPADCSQSPVCGNGVCENGENNLNCPGDCPVSQPVCGNNVCESDENSSGCPQDCGVGTVTVATNVSYGSDAEQKMDLYYFKNGSAPLALLVHGGGWTSGDKKSMLVYKNFFIEKRIAVASVNYRLSSATENSFPIPMQDVACSLAFLKKNAVMYGINPEKTVLVGHSAGAHLAAMVAYDHERNWLEGCGTQNESLSVKGFVGSSGPYDFGLLRTENAVQLKEFLGSLYEGGDWGSAEPITFVNAGDPPALLITGDADCFLNKRDSETGKCFANSQAMKKALDNAGVESQLLVIPGYKHNDALEKFEENKQIQDTLAGFVNSHLS
jgi:acetyl esterase/lipase